jgi:hypothetical protein
VEQPVPPVVDQAPAKPSTQDAELRSLQAEYTRKSQRWAAARRELGLEAGASEDDLVTAIKGLREKAEIPDPELEGITDPRTIEIRRRAETQLWTAQETVHGQVARAGRELRQFMLRTDDPEAIVDKMYEVLGTFTPAAEAAPAEAAPAEPAAPAPSYGLMDADTRTGGPVVRTQEVPDELRGSGTRGLESWIGTLLRRGNPAE